MFTFDEFLESILASVKTRFIIKKIERTFITVLQINGNDRKSYQVSGNWLKHKEKFLKSLEIIGTFPDDGISSEIYQIFLPNDCEFSY